MKKVFVWIAHPKAGSLSATLGQAYAKGAEANGAEVRIMNLSDMDFVAEFDGYTGRKGRALAPDLAKWQDAVTWADHVLIVHPYWWGAMPTKAKAVLDIALETGFAFKYHEKGLGWDKLLSGRTGDAIITSDTPPWLDTLLYRKPGRRVIRNQIMGFVGIKARKVVQFGSVKVASAKKIARWIAKAERMGAKAARLSFAA
jgi:putative NADPH-quinone reductase